MNPSARISELRSAYHDSLRRDGVAESVHAHIQKRALERNLSYGDRVICQVLEPLFLDRDHYEHLLMRAERLASALTKVVAKLRRDPAQWARLCLDEHEQAVVDLDGGFKPHDLIGRMDAFVQENGEPVFLEYNGESPGGIAYGDSLGQVFDELPLIQELAQRFPMSRRPVMEEIARTFRAGHDRFVDRAGRPGPAEPTAALLDFGDIPTLGEFQLFCGVFEAQGMPCRIVTPEELRIEDERLVTDDGYEIDIVYRRMVTHDMLERLGPGSIVEEIARRKVAFMANGFEGYLYCHKGLFAFLSDPDLRPADLEPKELETIAASVPWTRLLEDGARVVGPDGGEPEPLLDIARRERERFVLKHALGYGGREVVLGWHGSREDWDRALASARDSGRSWLLQERVQVPVSEHPALIEGRLSWVPLLYDIDPYILNGHRGHGVGVRLSASDILNVASGAGSAIPAYVVS